VADELPSDFAFERTSLYTPDELTRGFDGGGFKGTVDARVAAWGARLDLTAEDRARQSRHDFSIQEAVLQYLQTKPKLVGIMGGHDTARDHPQYRAAVVVSARLAAAGYTIVTGGGLGIMEAANLGAWMASFSAADQETVLAELARVPDFAKDPDAYFHVAMEMKKRWAGQGTNSLAVPTWLYGGEPVSLFASHIAKYFANSVREDGLLTIAAHGVVYFEGGAGTLQEVFQDAAQNAYWVGHTRSPMVLFGDAFFNAAAKVWPSLQWLANKKAFSDMIALTDSAEAVVDFIIAHPPILEPSETKRAIHKMGTSDPT
jgi:predicted Rossmann-fold nucleotide-binding protein